MEQNSLIEIGSKADVIIRFNVDTKINGRDYKANEPYLRLKNVNVSIQYDKNEKTATTRPKNVVSTNSIDPSAIAIGNIPFSRKLVSLLASYRESNVDFNSTKFRTLVASRGPGDDEGVIFLLDEIDPEKDVFVYDSDFEPVEFGYVEEMNALESEDFWDGEEYLISFSSVEKGTKFDLKQPCLAYLSLEVQGVGNINKNTKKIVLYFEKVSLSSIINFTFFQDEIIHIPLTFVILKGENTLYFED